MSRVRSFAVAFNYLILNYLRLIYAQFLCHFLTAILLFLVLGCIIITSSDDIQPSTVNDNANHYVDIKITGYRVQVLQAGA